MCEQLPIFDISGQRMIGQTRRRLREALAIADSNRIARARNAWSAADSSLADDDGARAGAANAPLVQEQPMPTYRLLVELSSDAN